MKNKKLLALVGTMAVFAAGAVTVTGCSKSNVDSTKTQLYVLNYQGGYGKKWLDNAARRYEEMYKETSFQEGKKGLEIIVKEEKSKPANSVLKNSSYELICFEGMVYKDLMADNMCADITKYVTQTNKYESKSIESKMYDEQKDFFCDNGKYYVLPNYVGTFGIVYNKKVFDTNGFYFAEGYETASSLDEKFTPYPEDRSAGPDGVSGTDDDGLPVTYEDYYDLCNYIDSRSMTPLIWMGKNSENYLTELNSSLIANYDGYEAYKSNYLMDGTFEAVKLDETNKTVLFNEGGVQTEMVTVHPNKIDNKYDGYEIQRSASKYYSFDFMRKVIDNKSKWAYDRLNDSLLHTDAQRLFINSQFGTLPSFKKPDSPIAMLFEGNWWESEASEAFNALSQEQKNELDYGWMPLPRNTHSTNKTTTSLNSLTSYMFVKSGLPQFKTDLAADFLQYLNTDEAYQEFTVLTSAIKSFKYEMSEENKAKMTKFGQHFWDYFQKSEKIFPESHNEQFKDALSSFALSRRYFTKDTMTWPSKTFAADPSATAGTYLYQMYHYYKDSIWSRL